MGRDFGQWGSVTFGGEGKGRLGNRSYVETDGRDWRGMATRILGEPWNDKLEEWDGFPHLRGQGDEDESLHPWGLAREEGWVPAFARTRREGR